MRLRGTARSTPTPGDGGVALVDQRKGEAYREERTVRHWRNGTHTRPDARSPGTRSLHRSARDGVDLRTEAADSREDGRRDPTESRWYAWVARFGGVLSMQGCVGVRPLSAVHSEPIPRSPVLHGRFEPCKPLPSLANAGKQRAEPQIRGGFDANTSPRSCVSRHWCHLGPLAG